MHLLWDERAGSEVVVLLARRAVLAIVPLGCLLATLVFAAVLGSAAYWVAEALLVPVFAGFFWRLRRSDRQIAAALSRHLGSPVDPRALPSFRSTDRFDKWLAVREGRAQRRTLVSSPEGFFKITLPPK